MSIFSRTNVRLQVYAGLTGNSCHFLMEHSIKREIPPARIRDSCNSFIWILSLLQQVGSRENQHLPSPLPKMPMSFPKRKIWDPYQLTTRLRAPEEQRDGGNFNNYNGRGENPITGYCRVDTKSGINLGRFSGGLNCWELAVTPPCCRSFAEHAGLLFCPC